MTESEDFSCKSENNNGSSANEPDGGFSPRICANVLFVTISKYDGETLREQQSLPVRVDHSGVWHRWVSPSCYVRSYLDGRRLRVRIVMFPPHVNQSRVMAMETESR